MKKTVQWSIAALVAAGAIMLACAASASAFFAWRVTDVVSTDVLMVRSDPTSASPILVGYPSGVVLSMTGRCTGDIHLGSIAGLPSPQQRQLVGDEWCEVWLDPYATGEFRSGWVFGRYIEPV